MTPPEVPPAFSPRRRPFSFVSRTAAWLFSQKHFHVKLLSGTAAGVLVIVFLAGLFLVVTYRNHLQEALRTHTIDVMRLSSVIENDIAALETDHRAFLLTGNPNYLSPFERRRDLLKERIDNLTALILNSSPQRKRVMKVQEIVQKWLANIALPEITARQSKAPGSTPMAFSGLGNSLLDQARELL